MEGAFTGVDDRRNGLVGHGQDARLHAKRGANGFRSFRERLSFGKHGGPMNVRSEVAVAEIEPVGPAIFAEALEGMKRFAANTPPFRRIHNPPNSLTYTVAARNSLQ